MRSTLALLLTALWLYHPSLVLAQPSPVLVVTLKDAAGQGVPGVMVLVRDRSGQQLLGDGQTGPDGWVTVEDVPAAEVRVAVRGATDGIPLVQLGDDAEGILVFLDAPTVVVDLRVEDGGQVVPDPSMFAAEHTPASAAALPTASLAATSVAVTGTQTRAGTVAVTTTGAVDAGSPVHQARGGDGWLLGPLLILGLVAAIVAVLAHERRAV